MSAITAALLVLGGSAGAQTAVQLRNDLPDPYRIGERWGELPAGRSWGQVATVEIDRDGKSVWVLDRCGSTNCTADRKSTRLNSSHRL